MRIPRFLPACLGLMLLLWPAAVRPAGQSGRGAPVELPPGSSVHGDALGAQTDWGITLKQGAYFEILVEKTGTDLEIALYDPKGKKLRASRCSQGGPFKISEIAEISGSYVLKVNGCDAAMPAGRFDVRLSVPRTPSAADSSAVAANRLRAAADVEVEEYRAEATQDALRKYEQAAALWERAGATPELETALNTIARLDRDTGQLRSAEDFAAKALNVALRNGLPAGAAYLSQAMIAVNQGDPKRSLDLVRRTIADARSSRDKRLEAEAESFLGTVYFESLGNNPEAIAAAERAEEIWAGIGDRLGVAHCLYNLASIDYSMTRLDTGPRKTQEALSIFESLNDRRGEAWATILLGHFQFIVGKKQEALTTYERERPVVVGSGDLFTETMLLNSLARVYVDLGAVETALPLYQRALAKNQELKDDIGIAYSFMVLGETELAAGSLHAAVTYLSQALNAFQALKNPRMEGWVFRQLGLVDKANGDLPGALDALRRAVELSRSTNEPREEAAALITIGQVAEQQGDIAEGQRLYRQAAELSSSARDPFGQIQAEFNYARSLSVEGKLEDALSHAESALQMVEQARANVDNRDLRMSYFSSVRQQYELYIDILMRLYQEKGAAADAVRAFEASERSHARILLEGIGETQASITEGIDPKQLQRQTALQALLATKAEQYTKARAGAPASKATADLADEIRMLTADYEDLQSKIRVESPRYAALLHPEPLKLPEIQKDVLDDDTILLEYAVGQDRSYGWAVTRDGFAPFTLPGRPDLESKVGQLRDMMTARSRTTEAAAATADRAYGQIAGELSRMLFGSVENRIGAKRLVIVGDGVLQSVPFAALPAIRDGIVLARPLIVEREVIVLPSASTLSVLRLEASLRKKPDRLVAVFADPIFNTTDSRLRNRNKSSVQTRRADSPAVSASASASKLRGIDLSRLSSSKGEAQAILRMASSHKDNLAALGFDATKSAVMSPELSRYRIVHFATHTILNDAYPELSALVLSLLDNRGRSQDGFLWLRDTYNLKLAADLVVLSACDTGIGKEVRGEGLMSLVRGFMYSGTPRVLASLWKVDDEATAALMTEFYRQLFENNLTPAAALRQAQIIQMEKNATQPAYYWAGFELQGDWRP